MLEEFVGYRIYFNIPNSAVYFGEEIGFEYDNNEWFIEFINEKD